MRTWAIQATAPVRDDLWAEACDMDSTVLKQWLQQKVCDQPVDRVDVFKEWVMNIWFHNSYVPKNQSLYMLIWKGMSAA